jgi:hypothetical protein
MDAVKGNDTKLYLAAASLCLGFIGLCAWFLPICGLPVTLAGFVIGIIGITAPESTTRIMAAVGVVLCGLGILASVLNALLGLTMFIGSL